MATNATRALALTVASTLVSGWVAASWSGPALGQERGGASRGARRARSAEERRAPDRARSDRGSEERTDDREAAREADPDAPETSEDGAVEARSTEVVERSGTKVKVIQFSGLDVSGRLKSPQLLYFLNRVRAEFDRPRLPHRSFVPELERTTRTDGF